MRAAVAATPQGSSLRADYERQLENIASSEDGLRDEDLELQILLRIVEVIDRKSQQKGTGQAGVNSSGHLANIVNNFIASTPSLSFIDSRGGITMGDNYTVGQAGAAKMPRPRASLFRKYGTRLRQYSPPCFGHGPTAVADSDGRCSGRRTGEVPCNRVHRPGRKIRSGSQRAECDGAPKEIGRMGTAGSQVHQRQCRQAAIKASLGI